MEDEGGGINHITSATKSTGPGLFFKSLLCFAGLLFARSFAQPNTSGVCVNSKLKSRAVGVEAHHAARDARARMPRGERVGVPAAPQVILVRVQHERAAHHAARA